MVEKRNGSKTRGTSHMKNKKQNTRGYHSSEIYDGNTVRIPWEDPVVQPKQKPVKKRPVSKGVQRNRERALRMNFGYVVFLAVAASLLLFFCASYIRRQSEISQRARNIAKLESQLESLKVSNDDAYNSLMATVDLNHIKDVAINELGMVYADSGQIVTYSSQDSDYVRQYRNVPQEKSSKSR